MPKKNPAAVSLGRKGGKAKVPKGASKWPAKKRVAIAKKAAKARWDKYRLEHGMDTPEIRGTSKGSKSGQK